MTGINNYDWRQKHGDRVIGPRKFIAGYINTVAGRERNRSLRVVVKKMISGGNVARAGPYIIENTIGIPHFLQIDIVLRIQVPTAIGQAQRHVIKYCAGRRQRADILAR